MAARKFLSRTNAMLRNLRSAGRQDVLGPLFGVAFLTLFFIVSTHGILPERMLSFGDLPAYPTDPWIFAQSFLDPWSSRGMGGPGASVPAALLGSLFLWITGGSASLAQDLVMFGWIPVAIAAVFHLVRRSLDANWGVTVATAAVYVATPVAVGLVVAGATALLWVYALTPLLISTAQDLSHTGGRRWAPFAVTSAAISAWVPELILFSFLVALVWIVTAIRGRRATGELQERETSPTTLTRAFAISLLLAFLAASPGLVSRYLPPTKEVTERAVRDARYTYKSLTPSKMARLAGNRGDPMHPLGYNRTDSAHLLGYVPFIIFLLGLLWRSSLSRLAVRILLLFLVAAASLLAYRYVALAHPSFLTRIPAALVFRNPEKLSILLSACLVAGFAVGAEQIRRRMIHVIKPPILTTLVVGLAVVYVVGYGAPAISGDWGIRAVRGTTFSANESLQDVASHLTAMDPSVDRKWRVLWLPFSSQDALSLQWIMPRWVNEPVLENTSPNAGRLIALLNRAIGSRDADLFHLIADRASVRYVVIQGQLSVPDRIERFLQADPDLHKVAQVGDSQVFENDAALPRVRTFDRLAVVAEGPTKRSTYGAQGPHVLGSDLSQLRSWEWSPAADHSFNVNPQRGIVDHVSTQLREHWPILSRRVKVTGGLPYRLSAFIRVQDSIGAHVKVVWYRARGDIESNAIGQDQARPVVSGTEGWTRVSASVVSPPLASFADVQFFAGKKHAGGADLAESWVTDFRFGYDSIAARPSRSPTEALVALSETEVVEPSDVIVDGSTGRELIASSSLNPKLRLILVNPARTTLEQNEDLLDRTQDHVMVFEPHLTLGRVKGDWRLVSSGAAPALEVGGVPAVGEIELPIPKSGAYLLSLNGCDLGSAKATVLTRMPNAVTRLDVDQNECGALFIKNLFASPGSTLRLRLPPKSTLRSVVLFSNPRGTRREEVQTPVASSSDPGSNIALQHPIESGVVLADTFDLAWGAQGSDSHFLADFSFNGFLGSKRNPIAEIQYERRTDRFVLIWLSGAAWLFLGGIVVRQSEWLRRPNPPTGKPLAK